ncbi:MAG: cache domain-containing protein, partial [Desulfobacterales bacterium]|nr:cache domain-containing protein [Desulfobacterales bacterium]
MLVPILLIQGYFYYDLFRTRRATELQANLELARAVGVAFNSFVQDLLHQQISIAITATASPPLSEQDLTKVLSRSAGYYTCVHSFSWVDSKGRILASSSPELIGMELSKKDHILEIESGREWALSNLFLSDGTGEPIFSISHCVRNAQGSVLGMVVATVRADGLQEVLSIERAKDAGVCLVDRNGMAVATYPAKEFTWEQRNWLKRNPRKVKGAIEGREIATIITSGRTAKKRLIGV